MRQDAIFIGAQLKAQGQEPSYRRIAMILRVSPTTVMRWFPDGEFSAAVAKWGDCFNESGNFISPLYIAVACKVTCATAHR